MWCPEAESNHRHGDFQSPALPTELSGQMVGLAGLEPATSRLSGVRSNHLSYRPLHFFSITLVYFFIIFNYLVLLVEVKGLEPPAPWSQTMCATKLRYTSKYKLVKYCFKFFWQGWRDSNPRRTVLETDALPTELHPYIKYGGPSGTRTPDLPVMSRAL